MTPVTNNQHLNNLISILRVAVTSPQWQIDHWPGQPDKVSGFLISFDRAVGWDGAGEPDPVAAVELVVSFLSDILQADPQLKGASLADIDWLQGFRTDEPEIGLVLSTIWLWLRQIDELLTAQEVLQLLPEDKQRDTSGIRKRLRAGDFPGALKLGRTWVIPKSTLVALGWLDSSYLLKQIRRIEDVHPKPKRRRPGRPAVERPNKPKLSRGRPRGRSSRETEKK